MVSRNDNTFDKQVKGAKRKLAGTYQKVPTFAQLYTVYTTWLYPTFYDTFPVKWIEVQITVYYGGRLILTCCTLITHNTSESAISR